MSFPVALRDPDPATPGRRRRTLVTSVSSDSHTWNLVYLQLLLEELGDRVHTIGACVPDDLLLDECRRHRPDLVVVSSVNGHGFLDGRRLIARLRREPDLAGLPVVIGGRLGTEGAGEGTYGPALLAAGFTAVFEGDRAVQDFRSYLTSSHLWLSSGTSGELVAA